MNRPCRFTHELETAMEAISHERNENDVVIKEMTIEFEKRKELCVSTSNKKKQDIFINQCLPNVCPVETEMLENGQITLKGIGTFHINDIKIVLDVRKSCTGGRMGNIVCEYIGWQGWSSKKELMLIASKEDKARAKSAKLSEFDWKLQISEIRPDIWIIDPVHIKTGHIYFLTEFSRFRVDKSVEDFIEYLK